MDPAAAAQIQQMAQQIAQLQQFAAQQQQIAAAAAAAAAAPAPAPAAAAPRGGPRLPPPAPFEGSAVKLDDYSADMQQQFSWYAIVADPDKVRFGVGFLRGAARDWWTNLAAGAQPATWDELIAALRARFQPVTTAETARAKLHSLSQGKASAHDYISAFRRLLVAVPDMAEADRLFAFTRGLNPAIAMQIRVQGIATLEQAIAMATRIGGLREI
jgi:hypothetical protein